MRQFGTASAAFKVPVEAGFKPAAGCKPALHLPEKLMASTWRSRYILPRASFGNRCTVADCIPKEGAMRRHEPVVRRE